MKTGSNYKLNNENSKPEKPLRCFRVYTEKEKTNEIYRKIGLDFSFFPFLYVSPCPPRHRRGARSEQGAV